MAGGIRNDLKAADVRMATYGVITTLLSRMEHDVHESRGSVKEQQTCRYICAGSIIERLLGDRASECLQRANVVVMGTCLCKYKGPL
ncbi:hypothetical protein TNCV_2594031 [Trichonephila clavipes]|nr:hypothetical protein TNCV_2594031 [Trichonephila clavipes]